MKRGFLLLLLSFVLFSACQKEEIKADKTVIFNSKMLITDGEQYPQTSIDDVHGRLVIRDDESRQAICDVKYKEEVCIRIVTILPHNLHKKTYISFTDPKTNSEELIEVSDYSIKESNDELIINW